MVVMPAIVSAASACPASGDAAAAINGSAPSTDVGAAHGMEESLAGGCGTHVPLSHDMQARLTPEF